MLGRYNTIDISSLHRIAANVIDIFLIYSYIVENQYVIDILSNIFDKLVFHRNIGILLTYR